MFKYFDEKAQMIRDRKKQEQLEERQNNSELATSIAFVTLAESGTIDDITATEHTNLFSPWVAGVTYKVGDLRQYNETLYRCVQEHTSQEDWTPDATAALWSKVGDPAEEYPEWSQPIGAQDAYEIDDKVTHNNKKWISVVDNNVWEPGVYGWNEINE